MVLQAEIRCTVQCVVLSKNCHNKKSITGLMCYDEMVIIKKLHTIIYMFKSL